MHLESCFSSYDCVFFVILSSSSIFILFQIWLLQPVFCNNKLVTFVLIKSIGNHTCSKCLCNYICRCFSFDFPIVFFLLRSQMINNEDYQCISTLDSEKRTQYLQQNADQSAKTFLNLLSHVSKDQTIQYILVMIDDLLQEDRSRIQIFHDYASRRKETVWGPFLNLLNRQNGFIVNMSSRILAKLACWSSNEQMQMPKSDLHFYLQWLKDQLTLNVSKVVGEYRSSLGPSFKNEIKSVNTGRNNFTDVSLPCTTLSHLFLFTNYFRMISCYYYFTVFVVTIFIVLYTCMFILSSTLRYFNRIESAMPYSSKCWTVIDPQHFNGERELFKKLYATTGVI